VRVAEIAGATGRAGEAAGYRALLAKLRSAFNDGFVAAVRAAGWHLTTRFAGIGYSPPPSSSPR
jgi:hypothetical protein